MYALFDGNYSVSGIGNVKIEYMNSGYLESAVEYALGLDVSSVSVGNFSTQATSCTTIKDSITLLPSHVYSVAELMEYNTDE